MTQRILIVDPNQAFATMLKQCVEEAGDYRAVAVNNGRDALRSLAKNVYHLAVIDMGLEDVEGPKLVRRMRQEHPNLCLMVIPLHGDQPPAELADVTLQGTLPKPFFLPELPDRIAEAIAAAPASGEIESAPALAPPTLPTARTADAPDLTELLTHLAREVSAGAVLLTQGPELLAHVSQLPDEEVQALSSVIQDSWRTSARVAQILGKEQLRFEQSIEGDEHLLYSLALSRETILSVIVQGHVPLGMIRHRAKETAEAIRSLLAP